MRIVQYVLSCLFLINLLCAHQQTAPPPATASAQSADDIDIAALEIRVTDLINVERAKRKLDPLKTHKQLVDLARAHSADMAVRDYVSHNTPEGLSPSDRAKAARFECKATAQNGYFPIGIAENILMTSLFERYEIVTVNGVENRSYDWKSMEGLANEIVTSWMGSRGHRENILHKGYTLAGLGIATNLDSQVFVTQNFC